MLGLGLSLQKGISAFNAGRALVSSYIRRVTEAGGVLQNTACDAAAINELNQDRLLEPASWVLVPDGIKEDVVFAQKPTSGLGDLSFSRASDATYTDSTGVVRRSPYNLVTSSSDFSQSYSLINSTITTNTITDPFGTLLGDSQLETIATDVHAGYNDYTVLVGSQYTFSVYVKSIGGRDVRVSGSSGIDGPVAVVNLSNGAILSSAGTIQVTNAGNGWYRISITATATTTTARILIYSTVGTQLTFAGDVTKGVYLFGRQLVEGTSALDYFPTTDRQNVPRIDFRNADGTLSSCGRLLLEPQRTNLNKFSEQFNNAVYTNQNITVTANATTSPDGNANADKLVITGTGVTSVYQEIITTPSNTYTVSAFVKKAETQYANLGFIYSADIYAGMQVDLNDGSIKRTFATFYTSPTSSVTNYGNGWYRLTVTCVINTATAYPVILPSNTLWTSGEPRQNLTGNNTTGAFFYGLQAELGAYPTTYIPTTTAAVTRIAEAVSKTGVSSLIGQTEGTLFVDFVYSAKTGNNRFSISSGSSANWIFIATPEDASTNRSRFYIRTNNTIQVDVGTTAYFTFGQRYKLAFAYKSGSWAVYGNGTLLYSGTHSISAVSSPLSVLNFFQETGQACDATELMNQAALFPTRLSNDQLEVLTSEGYGTYALLAESLNYVLQ